MDSSVCLAPCQLARPHTARDLVHALTAFMDSSVCLAPCQADCSHGLERMPCALPAGAVAYAFKWTRAGLVRFKILPHLLPRCCPGLLPRALDCVKCL